MNGNGYTASEISFIVDAYPKLSMREIALQVGRTYYSLQYFIRKLLAQGIISKTHRGYNREWSEWELEFLEDNWGLCNTAIIAKRLRRAVSAVEVRAHKLRLRRLDSFYTYSLLSKELNRNRTSLRNYYDRGWIQGEKASWTYRYGEAPMMFMEEDIVKFLQEHCDLFNAREIPNLYFRNIVRQAVQSEPYHLT